MRLCLLKKNNKTRGKTSGAIGLDLGVFVLGLVGPTPESTAPKGQRVRAKMQSEIKVDEYNPLLL